MNKKILTPLIILGVLILAYFFVNEGGSSGIKSWKAVEGQMDKIQLVNDHGLFELKKTDKSWIFDMKSKDGSQTMAENFSANKTKVTDIINLLKDEMQFELISTHDAYSPFELDEKNRMHLIAYIGEEKVRELWVGKTSSSLSHTYVMLAENADIYQTSGDFKDALSVKRDDLRDKAMLSFNRMELVSINIREGNKETSIVRHKETVADNAQDKKDNEEIAPKLKEYWKDESGNQLNEEKMNNVVSSLSSLMADSFLETKSEEMQGKIVREVTIRTSSTSKTLTLYKKDGEDQQAKVTDQDYGFVIAPFDSERLLVSLGDLKKK